MNAKIIKYNKTKQKYLVKTNNDDTILLSDKYIQQILTVTIINLVDKKYMNNQICSVNEFCKKTNRFKVSIFGSIFSLRHKNLIINNNSCVKIHNLKNNTELNDKWCTILLFDKTTGRYLVDLGNNKHIKINQENIIF